MKRHGLRKYSEKSIRNTTYSSWSNMKRRCNSDLPKDFKSYKGKGIGYPQEWEDFNCFVKDMGTRPPLMTLDRKENSLSYSKENCRWASYSKQNTNRRTMSNTGEKHISLGKDGRYQVHVHPFKCQKIKNMEGSLILKDKLLNERKFINFIVF